MQFRGQKKVYVSVDSIFEKEDEAKYQLDHMQAVKKLNLFVGQKVMLIRNMMQVNSRLVNGSLGQVIQLEEQKVRVHFSEWNITQDFTPCTFSGMQ